MRSFWFGIGLGWMMFAGGCASRQQIEPAKPICLKSVSMDQVFSAAERTLVKMQFSIEKADPKVGQIITFPLRGAQFFEFWRADNADALDTAEASIHSLQRIAEVRLESEGEQVCLNCRVLVRRLSLPNRPLEGMSRAGGLFTDSGTRSQSLQMRKDVLAQAEWIYLGTDPALEAKILRAIQETVQRGETG
ncbi:MAG TPA: hypothetical protein PLX18_01205 [Anaerohalosphaeraceae bacterium]|mgnify:CR=1 FL=1|nr:hypothetical protein [Anaerohalosphaeraceae bacterium]HQG04706.1 hypothetical protein [Anaerohalosphaeraceae bacterium]HQI06464.1 hypothetical protein [Anaerohalosphaeraceae bacterium]HQJ66801.1 hypothetical protein [Anaerohalosphaeraceae bacterium]